MASVQEARPALTERLGIDFVVKQLADPETEIVAAAATLLGNLAHQDGPSYSLLVCLKSTHALYSCVAFVFANLVLDPTLTSV
jgi:hypothetical protein